ncbi:MAG: NAD(P)/FAD-dependent oxidoreductase [Thermodesulfobacteriota bacterium]
MDYDVVVIGAGNGGLTASATLARKGQKVLLLERHNIPGGCATSFCRGRFEFEVALHQLSGLGTPEKPGPLRMTLDNLGVVDDLEFVEIQDLYSVHMPDGFNIALKPDKKQVVTELKHKFPLEKEAIDRFFDLVYKYANDMVGAFIFRDPEPSRDKYPNLYRYALRSAKEVLDDYFQDPLLKTVISVYWGYLGVSVDQLSFAYLAMLLFQYIEFKPFHVKGGSQALSNAILNAFLNTGGRARFNCGAQRIIVEDNQVIGVKTDAGDTIETRCVVANISPMETYTNLIGNDLVPDNTLQEMNGRSLSNSAFSMFIGFDCEPDELNIRESTNFLMASTDIGGSLHDRMKRVDIQDELMVMSCYDISDPAFSPPGTCQVNLVTLKYGDPWLNIPPGQYHEVKYRCAESMLKRAEDIFPDIRQHIEEIDIATPLTHMRYLGHPAGAVYGFESRTKDSFFFQPGNRSPVKGLTFAGGWVGDQGFEPTLRSGTLAAKSILRQIKN